MITSIEDFSQPIKGKKAFKMEKRLAGKSPDESDHVNRLISGNLNIQKRLVSSRFTCLPVVKQYGDVC